jgi:hypothetical protein
MIFFFYYFDDDILDDILKKYWDGDMTCRIDSYKPLLTYKTYDSDHESIMIL